jgi:hypothetical protein
VRSGSFRSRSQPTLCWLDLSCKRTGPDIIALLSDPAAWLALLTLIALEVVLGVDNLIFIAILSNKLPVHQAQKAGCPGRCLAERCNRPATDQACRRYIRSHQAPDGYLE